MKGRFITVHTLIIAVAIFGGSVAAPAAASTLSGTTASLTVSLRPPMSQPPGNTASITRLAPAARSLLSTAQWTCSDFTFGGANSYIGRYMHDAWYWGNVAQRDCGLIGSSSPRITRLFYASYTALEGVGPGLYYGEWWNFNNSCTWHWWNGSNQRWYSIYDCSFVA